MCEPQICPPPHTPTPTAILWVCPLQAPVSICLSLALPGHVSQAALTSTSRISRMLSRSSAAAPSFFSPLPWRARETIYLPTPSSQTPTHRYNQSNKTQLIKQTMSAHNTNKSQFERKCLSTYRKYIQRMSLYITQRITRTTFQRQA